MRRRRARSPSVFSNVTILASANSPRSSLYHDRCFVGLRARELLREISRSHEMSIHAGAINRDHVHLLLSIPPHLSVSRAVQYLKGKSSHKLLSEYQSLRKRYWGQHLWSRGYWWRPVAMLPMKSGRSTSKIKTGRAGRQFQGSLTYRPEGSIDPASSRNPKPPPLGGGVFTSLLGKILDLEDWDV